MFYYEYVKIKGGKFLKSDFTEYRKIIDEYSQRGYRYAGYVPTIFMARGELMEIDLIFEMEER